LRHIFAGLEAKSIAIAGCERQDAGDGHDLGLRHAGSFWMASHGRSHPCPASFPPARPAAVARIAREVTAIARIPDPVLNVRSSHGVVSLHGTFGPEGKHFHVDRGRSR